MQNASIKVFPSKLDRERFEQCHAAPGQSFGRWLQEHVPAYEPRECPLFSASVNGVELPPQDWADYVLAPGDALELVVEARDPVTIGLAIIAVVAAGAAYYAAQQAVPDNYNSTTPDGSTIYQPNAQGNKPRLMGVVPEIAGRHKVFPDLLNQPRREYISNDQYLYLMLAVGVGEYDIDPDEIYIGNTPVSRYAGDIDYQVFAPGVDVSGHEAHRNVYTSPEVGGSAGQSGLELEGPVASAGGSYSPTAWTFSGTSLSSFTRETEKELGGGELYYPKPFPFPVNAILTISGTTSNDGDYRVVSIDNTHTATVAKQLAGGGDDSGWGGFTSANFASASITADLTTDSSYTGPFFACPPNETTDTIWLDFLLPQGIGELDDNGNFQTQSVTVSIEYRDEGAGSWTTVPHTFSGATNDQQGLTKQIALGSAIRPEVRVKRTTDANDDTRIYDTVQWTALKSELDSATSYADTTTIAVRLKGTNALAGSAENKFNLIATRKLPVYSGGSWSAATATSDIAPFFAYIIKDVGHSDSQLALEDLEALHTLWSGRGDTFSAVFDSPSTLFEALKRVLAVGYAEPTLDYGQIVPVRDGPRSAFEQMFQPDNMTNDLTRDIKLLEPDEPDGVEVEYFDPQTWKPATVLCQLPGDTGQRPKKVRAFGVTDKTKAWRYGMRQRRAQRYRRTRYSFRTEMDALNCQYQSYVALADDIPGYSQTGRVEAVSGRDITLDLVPEWGTGTHHIALRKPDGTLSGPYVAVAGPDSMTVTLDADLDFTPTLDGSMEPPLFMFGEAERWRHAALVTEIKPSGTDAVSVTAVNYDDRVYADDDNSPP